MSEADLTKRIFSHQELHLLHELYLAWYSVFSGSLYAAIPTEAQTRYSIRSISEMTAKEKFVEWKETVYADYITDPDECPWGMSQPT